MVRYATCKDLEKKLTHKLLSESNPQDRCPHLKIDRQGPEWFVIIIPFNYGVWIRLDIMSVFSVKEKPLNP